MSLHNCHVNSTQTIHHRVTWHQPKQFITGSHDINPNNSSQNPRDIIARHAIKVMNYQFQGQPPLTLCSLLSPSNDYIVQPPSRYKQNCCTWLCINSQQQNAGPRGRRLYVTSATVAASSTSWNTAESGSKLISTRGECLGISEQKEKSRMYEIGWSNGCLRWFLMDYPAPWMIASIVRIRPP